MIADCALYYPYIHIRDIQWLKASLLQFRQVQRMVPVPGVQANDDPELQAYTAWHGSNPPLLDNAELGSPRSQAAQRHLAERLLKDARSPKFVKRFGESAERQLARPENDPHGFQIHVGKLTHELRDALRGARLTWDPSTREPYDHDQQYVQLHPAVGEVVMATLGIACASGAGLDMLTQERSVELHRLLTEGDSEILYDRLLHKPEGALAKPARTRGGQLFEVMVNLSLDLNRLTVEALRALGDDREPIRRLMENLEQRVLGIPAMDPGKALEDRLRDEATSVLKAWEQDLNNVPNFVRRFFGVDGIDPAAKTTEKAMAIASELTRQATLTAAAGPGAGAGAHAIAGLDPVVIGGVGIGLVVVSHLTKSVRAGATRQSDSPYLYLTHLHRKGVLVRRARHLDAPSR